MADPFQYPQGPNEAASSTSPNLAGQIGSIERQLGSPPGGGTNYDDILRLLDEADNGPPAKKLDQPMIPEGSPPAFRTTGPSMTGEDAPDTNTMMMPDPVPTDTPGTTIDDDPSVFGRVIGRLMGSDVDDPSPWTRTGTSIAGSLAGGYLGAQAPGGPVVKGLAAVGGSMVGAGLGAAAPETTMEIMMKAGLLPADYREKNGLDNQDLMTVMEGEALLDAAGMTVLGGVKMAGRAFWQSFSSVGRAGKEAAEEAARLNIALMPVQVGAEGSYARGWVSVMGRFPYVGAGIRDKLATQMGELNSRMEGIPARFGPLATYDQASASILQDAAGYLTALNQRYAARHTELLARADIRGIEVIPHASRNVTQALLKRIDRATAKSADNVPVQLPNDVKNLRRLLTSTTRVLYDEASGAMSNQSLRQMDMLLQRVDEAYMAAMKGGNDAVVRDLERLRTAVQYDMVSNVRGAVSQTASTAQRTTVNNETRDLVSQFLANDEELTVAVNQLMGNTAGAKASSQVGRRMSMERSPTMRGIRMTDASTNIDGLAKSLVGTNSRQAITEVADLVRPETMQQITSSVFREALDDARIPESGLIDLEKFAERVGLNDRASGKYAATSALLERTGGMTMEDLETLVRVGRQASTLDVPGVSVLLARRATQSGIRSVINALIPSAALTGGASVVGGFAGALGSSFFLIMGARGVSKMISNPKTARTMARMFDEHATDLVRRTAYMRALEQAGTQLVEEGEATVGEARDWLLNGRDFVNELDRARKGNQ